MLEGEAARGGGAAAKAGSCFAREERSRTEKAGHFLADAATCTSQLNQASVLQAEEEQARLEQERQQRLQKEAEEAEQRRKAQTFLTPSSLVPMPSEGPFLQAARIAGTALVCQAEQEAEKLRKEEEHRQKQEAEKRKREEEEKEQQRQAEEERKQKEKEAESNRQLNREADDAKSDVPWAALLQNICCAASDMGLAGALPTPSPTQSSVHETLQVVMADEQVRDVDVCEEKGVEGLFQWCDSTGPAKVKRKDADERRRADDWQACGYLPGVHLPLDGDVSLLPIARQIDHGQQGSIQTDVARNGSFLNKEATSQREGERSRRGGRDRRSQAGG